MQITFLCYSMNFFCKVWSEDFFQAEQFWHVHVNRTTQDSHIITILEHSSGTHMSTYIVILELLHLSHSLPVIAMIACCTSCIGGYVKVCSEKKSFKFGGALNATSGGLV